MRQNRSTLAVPPAIALVSFAGLAAAQPRYPIFGSAEIVTTVEGSAKLSPAIGDVNGDGVPDLLDLERGAGDVGVLFSLGRARWADPVFVATIPNGAGTQDAEAADIDGDGDTDLVYWAFASGGGDAFFGALLNDGAGGFSVGPTTFFTPDDLNRVDESSFVDTIAVGDADGDGNLDLVVASDDLLFLAGDGAGGLAPPETLDSFATSVELVDIDGDGVDEIAAAGPFGFTVRQRQGSAWAIVASDPLDGEIVQATDLVSAPSCDGEPGVRLFVVDGRNSSTAFVEALHVSDAFAVSEGYTLEFATFGGSAVAGDFVGGPAIDLAFASGAILEDDTCGGIAVTRPISNPRASFLSVADVDLDGNGDLVSSTNNGIAVSFIEGDGPDRAVAAAPVFDTVLPGFDGGASGIASGDFDGDGRADVFVTTGNTPSSAVFYQEADGSFAGVHLPETSRSARIHAADLDGDGLDDALLTTTGVVVQVNFAEPGRAFAPRMGLSIGSAPREVRTGDVDNDGMLDILAQTPEGFAVLRQTAPRQFALSHTEAFSSGSLIGLAVGDLDGDGNADAVVGANALGVVVAMSRGDGTFDPAVSIDDTVFPEAFDLIDFDGDGDLDLVAIEQFEVNAVNLYENDGAGNLSRIATLDLLFAGSGIPGAQWVETGDIDRDGFLDIAVMSGNGLIEIFRGDGALGFTAYAASLEADGSEFNQFALADLTGDGFLDAALVSYEPALFDDRGGFTLLANRTTPQIACPPDLAAPFGALDLNDISAFITGFATQTADADLAPTFGVLDLDDLVAFIEAFSAGCG